MAVSMADTMAGHTRADDTTGVTVTGVIISRPDSEESDESKTSNHTFCFVGWFWDLRSVGGGW